MKRYNPSEIEPKWQTIWEEQKAFLAEDFSDKQKVYISCMFPYPSGVGMHVGHAFEHVIVDAIARFNRQHGRNVLNPMGWDSFGLPAENYAIKTGMAPSVTTKENIANFKNQLVRLGVGIDWSREINTSDPEYYRWTQWVFAKFFERGLAYQKESLQWWCPVDKTVLANEQVEGGHCWRCGSLVEKKSMKQWFFKITDYADALLDEIPDLDWPTKIKTAQTNWIGKSLGAEIEFGIVRDYKDSLKFTPDLTKLILEGKKTSTVRLEPKNVGIGEYIEFLTRDGETVTHFGTAKVTNIRQMSLGDIPSDLEGHEQYANEQEKLNDYKKYYGTDVTLGTECTIYDFDFIDDKITVFSTRPDTLFGATFVVLAPEHPLAKQLATDELKEAVEGYITTAVKKSEIDRSNDTLEKTGVFTGSYAVNPATGEKVPIWIADYVLIGYGTGAIMAVPAHDERDYAFAEVFNLPIKQVVADFTILDGDFAPREDWPTREKQVIDAIITDGKGNYLLQIEQVEGREDIHFVGGGVDDEDESAESAVRREVLEEVGYPSIISIRQAAPFTAVNALRRAKNRNHKTWGAFYEVVVDPSEQVKSEIDEGLHKVIWVKKDEVAEKINWPTHVGGWNEYLNGNILDREVREGLLVNSGAFDGMSSSDAREEIVAWLEQEGTGRAKTTYKMRDWLISRQRYWGAPIPIIHCPNHGAVAVPDDQLPVLLPEVADYAPKGDGKSALAGVTDWVNTTCPTCNGPALRETDTMDGYACSSWYLLRYADPNNNTQAWDPAKANYWAPVDYYVGGDHAVAHLLYVRFWTHVFNDMGLTKFKEPVKKLVYHGLIGAEDGTKMSKSKGNVIDPLDIINQGYGADALRTYELFMSPIELDADWDSRGIAGVYRFLNRVWVLTQEYIESDKQFAGNDDAVRRAQHKTIRKVTDDFHRLSFNTAISALMEYTNDLYKLKVDGFSDSAWHDALQALAQLIAPFAPHIAEELNHELGGVELVQRQPWPIWDDNLIIDETITIIVQVNGKLRAKLTVAKDASEDTIKQLALADEHVASFVDNKKPTKIIYVPGRLVNIVV